MLVIFDCDGVLVDTEEVSCRCFAAALAREGVHWTTANVMRLLMGRSVAACVEIVERETARRLPDDFIAQLQDRTFQAFREAGIQPVAGIAEALDQLDARAIPFCVASSGKVEKMQLTLGLAGLWQRFEGRVFSASMVQRGKPFPDLFLHAAKAMGAAPADSVVVEDAVAGVQAGRAAGMRVLAYAGAPWAERDALQSAGGELFDDMQSLPAKLGR